MADVAVVIAAANRAAQRRLAVVADDAQAVVFQAARAGQHGGSRFVIEVQRICVDGYHSVCDVAVTTLAEVLGSISPDYAQPLRNMLLVHQLAVDRLFKNMAAPGDAFEHIAYNSQLPEFQRQMDAVLEDTLADLAVGLAAGVNVSRLRGGVHVDVAGTAQVMIDSPGARQHVGGDMGAKLGADPKELLAALSGLRQQIAAAAADQDLRLSAEDAILAVEREVGSGEPDPSRLKRYSAAVLDIGQKLGISTAGSFLGRIAQWMAGLG